MQGSMRGAKRVALSNLYSMYERDRCGAVNELLLG